MLKSALGRYPLAAPPLKMTPTRYLALIFAIALAVLLGNVLILFHNMQIVKAHQAQITSTVEFSEELEIVFSLIKDIETGQRGFFISGNETFLEPFRAGVSTVFPHIARLRETQALDAEQTTRISRFEALTRELVEYHQSLIDYKRGNLEQTALDIVASGRGKALMDGVRQLVSEIRTAERRRLADRAQEALGSSQRIDRLFIAVAATNLILCCVTFFILRRNLVNQATETERLATESWLKNGVAQLNERTRGNQSTEALGEKALDFFASYINARVGALYLLRNNRLELVAALALEAGELAARRSIQVGETLVGDAVKRKQLVRLDNLPPGYLSLASGSGQASARDLILAPLLVEDEVVGLLELGGSATFSDLSLQLVEQLTASIALAFKAARSRSILQELLEETQRQAEELQLQQEELRVTNEELETQTQALKNSHEKLQTQQEELQQVNEELEQQAQALEAQTMLLNLRNQSLEEAKRELTKKAEDLEEASRYKSEFLANMSHELRTPLNSMLILATLLFENKEQNLTPKQVDFARTIYKSGNDLLALINDILDLSKVEAGKLVLQPETFSLPRMLEQLAKEFEPLAAEKGLAFNTRVRPEVPERIFSDQQRIEQILKNLLSNAFKFTNKGSVHVEVEAMGTGLPIAISITDTGIGVPPEKQQLIFEAFEQVDHSSRRAYGGTGLGLTISRQLANLLGGLIEIQSSAGKGSRFTLRLPLEIPQKGSKNGAIAEVKSSSFDVEAKSAAKPKPTEAYASSVRAEVGALPAPDKIEADPRPPPRLPRQKAGTGTGSERPLVLIVEDDESFGRSLLELARDAGFHAELATTGEAALEFVAQQDVSAILLDIRLPDVSGFGVLERLKSESRTRHIPIHVISGMDYSQNALNLGALGYLLKPASKEQIEQVFKNISGVLARQVKRVLVVEDDMIQREAINHLLGGQDIELLGASSAEEATELLRTTNVDCMILDLRLPDLSGFELLEQLDSSEEICRPPVIVYTGQDLTQDEVDRLRRYSDSIVIKGVRSPERLFDEVSLFLHRVEHQLPPDGQALLAKVRSANDPLVGRKILLVDDDMRNVFAMANALGTHGLKVVVARNGQEALDRLDQDEGIELVLMDIMMPVMDGYEAMTRIRKQSRFKRLGMIALTAKAMKGDQERCLQCGANDYLPKPVNLERLLSLIRVWLPRKHGV